MGVQNQVVDSMQASEEVDVDVNQRNKSASVPNARASVWDGLCARREPEKETVCQWVVGGCEWETKSPRPVQSATAYRR